MTAPDITTEDGRRRIATLDEIAAAHRQGVRCAGRGFFEYIAKMYGYSAWEAHNLADRLGFPPRWEVSDG